MSTAAAAHQRAQVLAYYRQLLRLARRLPPERAAAAADEARAAIRARAGEPDPERALQHTKELAARVAFLRMTTPRPAGEPLEGAGRFVWRSGAWQEGGGESKGERVADGSLPMEEAKQRNAQHYERFYGRKRPKEMFF
ncbi:hypothetical protein Rsub_02082 [Raphidocelis subcapitata]|uniref:Complex 1 LYR protein domain-containing protein n=1 Tax=Raphidocelis subcapitata TaxID=307507 RepID=A0A2V0NVB5_9CHLO|nr:hypothetical protein Rsub_02082 [Raphidocelis subcapitata]|eukprot:GBF89510.1 hypothetical protein Rsub_02082 [Raphidocelis subcapitata]